MTSLHRSTRNGLGKQTPLWVLWLPARLGPLALLLALAVEGAEARTWRVRRDGSGDFTTIQPAVDASADGDTVSIGPGRYAEMTNFSYDGVASGPTVVGVRQKKLVLEGTDRDAVILGPALPTYQGLFPKGIAMRLGEAESLTVRRMTIENMRDGILLLHAAIVESVTVNACVDGVAAIDVGGVRVHGSRFAGNLAYGAAVFNGSDVEISSCSLEGNRTAVACGGTAGIDVSGCTITGGLVGVDMQLSTTGIVQSCRLTAIQNVAVGLDLGTTAVLERNYIDGGDARLTVRADSEVTGSRNVITTGAYAGVLLDGGVATMHDNHFLAGPGPTVRVDSFQYSTVTTAIDLRGNWWGTTDTTAIAARIWDIHDDPAQKARVEFQPALSGPVPMPQQSVGRLKAAFGRK